jgi:predicted transcriptional regulator
MKKIRKILEAKMAVEVAAIQEGLAAADNGDLHDHDEVMTMMDDIIAHG